MPSFQVSKEDEVLFWNSGAQETFGYSAAEAVGRSLTDLIVPEKHKQMHSSGFAKVMAGEPSKYGRRDLLRVPALCKDGSRLAVEFTLLVLPDEHGAPSELSGDHAGCKRDEWHHTKVAQQNREA